MNGHWQEITRLRFVGERFRDHALDLTAITELRQFQRIVAETAKALWRAAHPGRERLPAHFDQRTRLCLRRIEEASTALPLEVYVDELPPSDASGPAAPGESCQPPERSERCEPPGQDVRAAVDLVYDVFRALEQSIPLPDALPRNLIAEYAEWGKALGPDESIELDVPGRGAAACVRADTRRRLSAFAEGSHEDTLDLIGEVLEADVRQRRLQLWIDDKTAVSAPFDESQEQVVTQALKDHCCVRLRVRGRGDVSPLGKPIRFTSVASLELEPEGGRAFDETAPDIEDEFERIAAQVPPEAWDRFPADLNDQLDHYIYGTPKR